VYRLNADGPDPRSDCHLASSTAGRKGRAIDKKNKDD